MEEVMETFMGRLGRDPELKYTPTGKAVCYLSVAVKSTEKDIPNWKRVIVWERQAEICSVQLKKGGEIFVQGRNERKEFTDKQGQKKGYEEVNARLVGFTNL